jgi:putative redox protein
LVGDLSAEQRTYLLGIANKCPVHKILTGKIEIATTLLGG